MKATQYPFDQISHFRVLVEQKGVSSDLLQEFYDSGLLADLLEVGKPKKLDREVVRKALGLPPLNPPLLEPIGTVAIAATIGQFIVREKFVLNYGSGAKPGVRIAYLGLNFSGWFFDKIEGPKREMTLRSAKLVRAELDKEIRKELGVEREETTLADIYALLEKQPDGRPGVLLTNGFANIFYVRDAKGVLRVVGVHWRAFDGGWVMDALSVEDPSGWNGGYQVFSCNS